MKTVSVGDVELSVHDEGSGPVILFVHGFPLNHHMWRFQLEPFARTHRVIAPDLRGFGESGVTGGVITMKQFADDLAALLDALAVTDPVAFCGLSMGGYVGWEFLRHHSHKVAKLIQCDTRAASDTSEAAESRRKVAAQVLDKGVTILCNAMLPMLFAESTSQRQPELIAETREMMLTTDPRGVAAAALGMSHRADMTDFLPGISVPTLMIVGVEDPISPVDEMRSMASAVPGAVLEVIPDAGHMAPMENAPAVNQTIERFLKA